MWGSTAASAYGPAGATLPPPPQPTASSSGQKHDIFVGNLAFNTTEEQLHQAFSEIGRVLKVRMVHDLDTGKPRGFAFVEFEDPQVALSAIRNMNEYELNGRRIRVNFSNSSHLEALAGKLGMDLQSTAPSSARSGGNNTSSSTTTGSGTVAVADAIKSFSKSEMYDVVAKLKEIADKDPDEARRLLSGHPQLPEAMLHIMSKLEMIQTPVMTAPPPMLATTTAAPPAATRVADPRARPADPRAATSTTTTATTTTAPPPPPLDPRARMADPRAQAQQQQQQQQQQQYGSVPPPPPQPPSAVSALDPALVQQVMSLSEEQIQQLPPDKQTSIRTLRQQITGGM